MYDVAEVCLALQENRLEIVAELSEAIGVCEVPRRFPRGVVIGKYQHICSPLSYIIVLVQSRIMYFSPKSSGSSGTQDSD